MKNFWKNRRSKVMTILFCVTVAGAITISDDSHERTREDVCLVLAKSFEPSAALERFRMTLGW
jgi:hypothetical protein